MLFTGQVRHFVACIIHEYQLHLMLHLINLELNKKYKVTVYVQCLKAGRSEGFHSEMSASSYYYTSLISAVPRNSFMGYLYASPMMGYYYTEPNNAQWHNILEQKCECIQHETFSAASHQQCTMKQKKPVLIAEWHCQTRTVLIPFEFICLCFAFLLQSIDDVVAGVYKPFNAVYKTGFRPSVDLGRGCSCDTRVPAVGRKRVYELLKALSLRLRFQKLLHLWIGHRAEYILHSQYTNVTI